MQQGGIHVLEEHVMVEGELAVRHGTEMEWGQVAVLVQVVVVVLVQGVR